MENATKALLIAAAVLVAILIISLGLVVYNKAAETVNNSGDLSEYEIQQFNQKFQKYEGDNVSGTEVNAMLQTVFNHNLAQADESTQLTVSVATQTSAISGTVKLSKTQTTSPEKVSTGKRYYVKAVYDSNSKLINSMIYVEK